MIGPAIELPTAELHVHHAKRFPYGGRQNLIGRHDCTLQGKFFKKPTQPNLNNNNGM